jgi:DNA-binding response OmpR family regulator
MVKVAKKKIIIAEDEKPMAHAMQLKLQREGFTVDLAGNGEEALAKVKKDAYDLLILDLVMPKMNGFDVLAALAKEAKRLKIIVASNLSQEQDSKKAKELGADDYFVKSNTPLVDLVARVRQILSV